jgi:hypothetical protein
MMFVTIPQYYELHRYDPTDSETHAKIIMDIGGARLQWGNNGALRVHCGEGDDAAWVTANGGEWVGVCHDFGCAHIFTDEEVTDALREVHQP